MKKIGIVITCTNAYFVLGIRFVKKFLKFYKGSSEIHFYLFTDTNPSKYLGNIPNIHFIEQIHKDWCEGTNSKYKNIVSLKDESIDYLYYFDADTNVSGDFTEEWFLGDLVGGQHYGDLGHMAIEGRPFDRNPSSKAYVPLDTSLPQMYYYGAFWGGSKEKVIDLCLLLHANQLEDKKIPYEPCWNDESYLNQYFHYNPPTFVVKSCNFLFEISDKGGIQDTRDAKKNVEEMKQQILARPTELFNIFEGNLHFEQSS